MNYNNCIAFTICANNYLAHAKTLATSFKAHHKDIKFVLIILDEPNNDIDYELLPVDDLIWAKDLIVDVDEFAKRYNIAELCTVIKPECILQFYELGFENVIYLDPDIQIFSQFQEVFEALEIYDVVLTPHICSPTGDVGHPLDKDLMRSGIYNLGFLAIKSSDETIPFLNWWSKRVREYGFHNMAKGYFYDQIWMGYAPAFLSRVYVLRHLGYNVANWNLHERYLIPTEIGFTINDEQTVLRFFHFSHFKLDELPIIARYNKNFTLNNRPDLVRIFSDYSEALLSYDYKKIKQIPFVYGLKNLSTGNQLNTQPIKPVSKFRRFLYLQKRAFNIWLSND